MPSSRARIDAERHISPARFQAFLDASNQHRDEALDLYEWNVRVSGAFFEDISALEVAMRNAMHEQLVLWCAARTTQWYDDPFGVLNNGSRNAIQTAKGQITRVGNTVTPNRVVANLSFGFWRFLLTGAYQQPLWVPCLQFAFNRAKRDRLEKQVRRIHELRNGVAHHAPIIDRDLALDYETLIATAEYVHPRLAWWIDSRSRVLSELKQQP